MIPPLEVIAYTAGMLDGEGSIQINPSKNRKLGKTYWNSTVQISSSCKEVLKWLKDQWGMGNITTWKPKGSRKNRRSYNWRIYSKDTEKFLSALLPYLIIKKEAAELAIEFRKYVGFYKGQLTEEISKKRAGIALQLMEINERYGKGQRKYTSYKDVA